MTERFIRTVLLLAIGVHLIFLLSLKFGWLNGLFNDSMHRFGPGGDFFSIYAAGVKARHGESLYTVGGHVEQVPYAYAFRYAPLVAYTLGLGLSFLPAVPGYALWLIVCELTLLRNIRLTLERAPDRTTGSLAVALWLLFTPYYLELYVGQFTFLSASLCFWAYVAWQDYRHGTEGYRAGITTPARLYGLFGDGYFALALWLKMMPLLYMPLAFWRGRWKGVLLTLGLLAFTSWLYFARHPGDWAAFVEINVELTPTWHAGNQGLMALLYAAVGENTHAFLQARLITILLVGGGLLWLIGVLWQSNRQKEDVKGVEASVTERKGLWLYAACSAAYLLLYKDVWEHHYVLLLPPLVLLCLHRERARLWLPPMALAALPTLFICYDVQGLGYNEDPQRYWLASISLLHHACKPLAPLWLFGGLLWQSIASVKAAGWRANVGRAPLSPPTHIGWRRSVGAFVVASVCIFVALAMHWVGAAIHAQSHLTRQLTWPDTLFQKQHGRETCGPAALAAVCRYYHLPATEEEIATLAGTDNRGTTMLGLQQAAQAKGLTASGILSSVPELAALPRPCILYFHQGHYAVLTGIQNDRYYVADPSLGQRVWTRDQLAYLWRGELLLVGPSR